MPRRNRGFEAFELQRARTLPQDEDEFRLLHYGEGIDDELLLASPPLARQRLAMGRPMEAPAMLDQPDSSNIGRSITIDNTTANPSTILDIKSSDKTCRQLSIVLSLEATRGTPNRDIVALVQWGSGGTRSPTVELDFLNGTIFSVACSALRITPRIDTVLLATTELKVGAFIGYGTRPAGKAAQRTLKTGALAIAGTVDLAIPAFAYDSALLRSPSTADLTLRYLDAQGAIISEIFVNAGAELEGRKIPIPGDATTLRIVNGGVAVAAGRAVFGLAL